MPRFAAATLCLVLLGSCTPSGILEGRREAPEGKYGQAVIEELGLGDIARIRARLVPEALTPDLDAKLSKISEQFPKISPSQVRLVGYNAAHFAGQPARYSLTYEAFYPDGNVLAGIAIRGTDQGDKLLLEGINVQKIGLPLDVINALTLRGKGRLHYTFVALALLALGVTLTAVIAWRRAGRIQRRWWWLTGILLGVGRIGVQWTTGALMAQPLSVQLLSVAVSQAGPFAPWVVTVSIPIGAIAFLIVRPRAAPQPAPEAA